MTKQTIAFILFVAFSGIHISGIIFQFPELAFFTKPLLLLSLLTLYVVSVESRNKFYVMALIFSFFGDVFLMKEGQLFFMIGLISFLIAHFFYIKIVLEKLNKISLKMTILSIIPFLIVLLSLLSFLKDYLNEMLIPVIIYGTTIAIFGVVSLIYFMKTSSRASLFMLVGAIIFMISDSVLAINKFYDQMQIFQIIVMFTYILAQFLIYKSMSEKDIKILNNPL